MSVEQELGPIGAGSLLKTDLDALNLEELIQSFASLDKLSKAVEDRKKLLRERLMSRLETEGTPTEAGHASLKTALGSATREKRRASTPNEAEAMALLEANGLLLSEGFDEKKVLVANPSKFEHLVNVGKLPAEAVEALRGETFALKVQPAGKLKDILSSIFGAATVKITETQK